MSNTTCHVSYVRCHVSDVVCHVSHVTCHMSHVTIIYIFIYFGQSGEVYRWRVCYQRGLPRLVITLDPNTSKRLRKHIKATKADKSCTHTNKYTEVHKSIQNHEKLGQTFFVMLVFEKVCKLIESKRKSTGNVKDSGKVSWISRFRDVFWEDRASLEARNSFLLLWFLLWV